MRPPIKSNTYAIGRSIEDSSCPQYVRNHVAGWRYRKAVRARCERLLTGWSLGSNPARGAKQNQVLTSFYISPRKPNFRLGAAFGVAPLVSSVYRSCVDVTPLRFGRCRSAPPRNPPPKREQYHGQAINGRPARKAVEPCRLSGQSFPSPDPETQPDMQRRRARPARTGSISAARRRNGEISGPAASSARTACQAT